MTPELYTWMTSINFAESNEKAKEASSAILAYLDGHKTKNPVYDALLDKWSTFFLSLKVYAFYAIAGDFCRKSLEDKWGCIVEDDLIGMNACQLLSVPDFLTKVFSRSDMRDRMKFYPIEFCEPIWNGQTLYPSWANLTNPLYMQEAERIHDLPTKLLDNHVSLKLL